MPLAAAASDGEEDFDDMNILHSLKPARPWTAAPRYSHYITCRTIALDYRANVLPCATHTSTPAALNPR
jgi:hypothetical protein